jgi:hypothetical protein
VDTAWRDLDKVYESSTSWQHLASLVRVHEVVPNGLGLPIRRTVDVPVMTWLRSAIRKPLTTLTTFTGIVDARFQ